jgi:hypothetical protein
MKKLITAALTLLTFTVAFAQYDAPSKQYLVDLAPNTAPTYSPGAVFLGTNYRNANFLLDNVSYINKYGWGFYDNGGGVNTYVSSYFGVDFFTSAQRRFRINQNGNMDANGHMSMWAGATVSGNYTAANPDYSWDSELSVWNYNTTTNAFSRITFGSDQAAVGTIAVAKTGQYTGDMYLQVRATAGNYTTPLFIKSNGNVGIGTLVPPYKLSVDGTIGAREVIVTSTTWPDYVFESNYKLPSLELIERYIRENQHLPEVPTAKEVDANGIKLAEMNALLLKKIEELTLYQIESNKQIQLLKKEVEQLKEKN